MATNQRCYSNLCSTEPEVRRGLLGLCVKWERDHRRRKRKENRPRGLLSGCSVFHHNGRKGSDGWYGQWWKCEGYGTGNKGFLSNKGIHSMCGTLGCHCVSQETVAIIGEIWQMLSEPCPP